MKRTKLSDRILPDYTRGEEIMHMVTHIVGGALGFVALILCVARAGIHGDIYGIVGASIYGATMIALYAISSVYHGLKPCMGKKVMQVMDHCTIYLLIAGTYTPVVLTVLRELDPALGWSLFAVQWSLALVGSALTAIDLHRYRFFAMACYIGMGWCIIIFAPQTLAAMTLPGFLLLLAGGISYTVGAILFSIKRKWMHSVFHIFVVLGSFLQFLAIFLYAL